MAVCFSSVGLSVCVSVRGNQMANSAHYQAAIDLFTEAIKLDPRDFRYRKADRIGYIYEALTLNSLKLYWSMDPT